MAQRVSKPSKLDYIIIISFLSAAIISIFYINLFIYKGIAKGVIIEKEGKIYAQYEFNSILNTKTVEIETNYGYNIIELEKGRARIKYSTCNDQICVNSGWIDKPNQMVVCLPNKVVVRLTGKSEVEYVSY